MIKQRKETAMKCPEMIGDWKVDEVIECLSMGAHRQEFEAELLRLMPNAYASHKDDPDGEAGRNEWPEAGSHKDRKLKTIWKKISQEVQKMIVELPEVKEDEEFMKGLMSD